MWLWATIKVKRDVSRNLREIAYEERMQDNSPQRRFALIRPNNRLFVDEKMHNFPSRLEHEGVCSFTLTVFLRQNVINNVQHVVMKIIWLIFSAVSWAEMKNVQRLEQAYFLVSQLRRSISRVLCAPTFKRIDFKPQGNLHMIVLFEQHAPPAFAYF